MSTYCRGGLNREMQPPLPVVVAPGLRLRQYFVCFLYFTETAMRKRMPLIGIRVILQSHFPEFLFNVFRRGIEGKPKRFIMIFKWSHLVKDVQRWGKFWVWGLGTRVAEPASCNLKLVITFTFNLFTVSPFPKVLNTAIFFHV